MYYIGITDTILLFQWLFPNSEQAKNFVSSSKVAQGRLNPQDHQDHGLGFFFESSFHNLSEEKKIWKSD